MNQISGGHLPKIIICFTYQNGCLLRDAENSMICDDYVGPEVMSVQFYFFLTVSCTCRKDVQKLVLLALP